MAQIRFFQHLNEQDDNFQKVTTLDYIDNSEGFTMYYFKDGSRCNKQYIAPVNANSIEGYEFAEVSSQYNIWKLNYVVPKVEKVRTATNAKGELVEAPSWEELTRSNAVRKPRIDVMGKPSKVENYQAPDDSEYFFDYDTYVAQKQKATDVKEAKAFDFNASNTTISTPIPASKFEVVKEADVISYAYSLDKNGVLHINADEFLRNIKSVQIEIGGTTCELSTEDFIENAITPKEEKVVEKVVEKEVLVKTSDTDIELGVNNDQKSLIDNMINMSNKTEYSIDIEFALNLPPSSIYKLIKTAYPEEMSKGFINILANRMQVKELKTSVADGLLAFYDEDIAENFDIKDKEEQPKNNIQKASRTKKTVNN
jgi:hypothetical protein